MEIGEKEETALAFCRACLGWEGKRIEGEDWPDGPEIYSHLSFEEAGDEAIESLAYRDLRAILCVVRKWHKKEQLTTDMSTEPPFGPNWFVSISDYVRCQGTGKSFITHTETVSEDLGHAILRACVEAKGKLEELPTKGSTTKEGE